MCSLLKSTLLLVFIQVARSTSCASTTVATGPCPTAVDGSACDTTSICATFADGSLQCCPLASVVSNTSSSTSTTTTPACVDLTNAATGVSDCAARAAIGYCTRRYYVTFMKKQCRKTCGYCTSSTSTNSTCVDLVNPSTGVSDCTRLSYLCSSSAYYSVMVVQCPVTCGFCSG
ncbi:unnamed protein product, partial [Mesorhabditis belari]|uniref:ShKT domain-containing protein n=1 Tax=Mesorhabditis belari TaxID=2138241 RepID=A0AAF3EHC0_9BILA